MLKHLFTATGWPRWNGAIDAEAFVYCYWLAKQKGYIRAET